MRWRARRQAVALAGPVRSCRAVEEALGPAWTVCHGRIVAAKTTEAGLPRLSRMELPVRAAGFEVAGRRLGSGDWAWGGWAGFLPAGHAAARRRRTVRPCLGWPGATWESTSVSSAYPRARDNCAWMVESRAQGVGAEAEARGPWKAVAGSTCHHARQRLGGPERRRSGKASPRDLDDRSQVSCQRRRNCHLRFWPVDGSGASRQRRRTPPAPLTG